MGMIVDTDVHCGVSKQRMLDFLREPWRTRVADGSDGPGHLGYWNPNGVNRRDAATPEGRRIEGDPLTLAQYHFDPNNIDFGILNAGGVHVGLSPEPDFAAAYCSAMNDVYVNDWLSADERFRYSMIVSPADPALAAEEIHRLGDHPGVVQVLMPSGAQYGYGHRFYHPIYEAAAEHGLAMMTHFGGEGAGVTNPPTAAGYPSYYLEMRMARPQIAQAHVVSLVCEGVFEKFPSLRWLFIEVDTWWIPGLMWHFDADWKALRDTTPWVKRLPSDYIREHVRVGTQPLEQPPRREDMAKFLDWAHAEEMLVYASDFPHWDWDEPRAAAALIPRDLRPRIFGETARELFGL